MAVLVVGGHTRNLGKTRLVTEIIRAFPAARWTAVKITQEKPGVCPVGGNDCGCTAGEHLFSLQEEREPAGRGDTSRFLAAGAERALWVRTKPGQVGAAWPALARELARLGGRAGAENVIIESNSILRFLEPDLYLPVLDFSRPDFKPSAREFLELAGALVVHAGTAKPPAWAAEALLTKPVFEARPDRLCSPELVAFLRRRLTLRASCS